MKRKSIGIALSVGLFGAALGLAAGCGKAESSNMLGGETHWLMSCTSDAACGGDLACLCGVCTAACESDAACSGAGADARCLPKSSASFAESCEGAAPDRICARGGGGGGATQEPMGNAGAAGEIDVPIEGPPFDVSIEGSAFDEANDCFLPQEVAGTLRSAQRDVECSDEPTFALDAAGFCWLFPTSCVPDRFSTFSPAVVDATCTGPTSFCPAADMCGDEEVATSAGCLGCEDARADLLFQVLGSIPSGGWDACETDLDCVAEGWTTACDGQCPVALNAQFSEEFQSTAARLGAAYCTDTGAWRDKCGNVVVDCDIAPICRNGTCVITTLPCADRSLDSCDDGSGDCVLASASPYDAANGCFSSTSVNVACVDPDQSCPPVVTPALDGEGTCYAFGNCLPAGFERAPDEHPCSAVVGSTCSE